MGTAKPRTGRLRTGCLLIAVTLIGICGADDSLPSKKSAEILNFAEIGTNLSKPAGTIGDVVPESELGLVLSIAFSPDGKLLALGGENPSVAIREFASNRTLAVLSGHTGPVTCVVFSPDGRILASAGRDRSVRLWDLDRGSEKTSLVGHEEWINALVFTPDGRTLISGGQDGTIKLWDVAEGRLIDTLNPHDGPIRALAISPDGQTLASGGNGKVVRLWDLGSKIEKALWKGHRGTIRTLAFSADGATLVSGGEDHLVRLWDVRTGTIRETITGHSDQVLAVAYSPKGQGLATAGYDSTLKLWDQTTSSRVPIQVIQGQSEGITAIAFHPKSGALVSAAYDGSLFRWTPTVAAARLRLTLATQPEPNFRPHFSPDSKSLVTATGDNVVHFWDATSGVESGKLVGHTANIVQIQFSRDGKKAMTTAFDKRLLFWDVAMKSQIGESDGSTQAFPRAGFAADGKSVALEGPNGSVILRDLETNESRSLFVRQQTEVINGLIFTPDETGLLIVLLSADFTSVKMKLVDVADGHVRGTVSLPNLTVFRVRFTPDSKRLAGAVGPRGGGAGQSLRFWDTEKLREVGKVPLASASLSSFNISPDGRLFAIGNEKGQVTLFDVASREPRATFKAHAGNMISGSFSPDGRMIVTVGNTRGQVPEVKIWDLNTALHGPAGNETGVAASKP